MNATTRMRWSVLAACAAAGLLAARACPAGSIWAKAGGRGRALYTDDTARRVGDALTILIEETSKIENETTRRLDKSAARSGKAAGTVDLGNMVNWLKGRIWELPNVNVNQASSNKFDGRAEFDSERKVADKITVTVEDVLPNGNLVVLGKRERQVAGDTQIVQASGIVRPSDIAFDNSVSSKKVADFKMVYKSQGQENHFVNPNWLARILNWLNPE